MTNPLEISEHEALLAKYISEPIYKEMVKLKSDIIIMKNNQKWAYYIVIGLSGFISGAIGFTFN